MSKPPSLAMQALEREDAYYRSADRQGHEATYDKLRDEYGAAAEAARHAGSLREGGDAELNRAAAEAARKVVEHARTPAPNETPGYAADRQQWESFAKAKIPMHEAAAAKAAKRDQDDDAQIARSTEAAKAAHERAKVAKMTGDEGAQKAYEREAKAHEEKIEKIKSVRKSVEKARKLRTSAKAEHAKAKAARASGDTERAYQHERNAKTDDSHADGIERDELGRFS